MAKLKPTLSVSIISFNEEKSIGATLEAIKGIADEIVVVDSHSTDRTIEIASAYGAKVFIEDWKGYVGQKNSALEKCTSEWVLSLDCDEVVTPNLRESILSAIATPKYDGYVLNRRTHYMGKLLKYAWQPDRKLRLVRNKVAVWEVEPQDVLRLKDKGATGNLAGDLIHYSFKDFEHHMNRTIDLARLVAISYKKRGKVVSGTGIYIRTLFAFMNKLFIKRGILDGAPGVMSAVSGAVYVYMKYSFLWELNNTSSGDGD